MIMPVSYEQTGRTNQKARTREALIAATRELLAQGATPGVEEAAGAAAISRATAYRYFPNRRALLAAAYPEIEAGSLLGADAPTDAEARLDTVVEQMCRFVVQNEPALRAALRLELEPGPAAPEKPLLRRGRAIPWIEDALAPLRDRMTERDLRGLTLAIRSAVGIEAFVWLTGVAGLSPKQAVESMRWSARALLRAKLAEL
jgi:AcrR family transcriptional regulator